MPGEYFKSNFGFNYCCNVANVIWLQIWQFGFILCHIVTIAKITVMIFEIDMKNNATLTEEFVSDLFFVASGGKFKLRRQDKQSSHTSKYD